jgi:gamma-glutamylcyclotransferase (GGCT)/AIG2-like uncharacterized protein YtfP
MYRPVYSDEYSALYFSSGPSPSESVFSGGCNVFVCGALQNPARMSALLGFEAPFASAAASGYKRSVEAIDGREIPFMVPDEQDPRSVLLGVVWLDLEKASLDRIESLELDGGYRRRIAIEARIGELDLTAYTYVRK